MKHWLGIAFVVIAILGCGTSPQTSPQTSPPPTPTPTAALAGQVLTFKNEFFERHLEVRVVRVERGYQGDSRSGFWLDEGNEWVHVLLEVRNFGSRAISLSRSNFALVDQARAELGDAFGAPEPSDYLPDKRIPAGATVEGSIVLQAPRTSSHLLLEIEPIFFDAQYLPLTAGTSAPRVTPTTAQTPMPRATPTTAQSPTAAPSTCPVTNLGTITDSVSRSGRWSTSDCVLSADGTYYDPYRFQVSRSTQVVIDLSSSNADSYLVLADEELRVLDEDDDSGDGLNARISRTLGAGTYFAVANVVGEGETGSYNLTISVGAAGTPTSSTYEPGDSLPGFPFGGRVTIRSGGHIRINTVTFRCVSRSDCVVEDRQLTEGSLQLEQD